MINKVGLANWLGITGRPKPPDEPLPPVVSANCLIGRHYIAGDQSGVVLGVLPRDWYLVQLFGEDGQAGVQRLVPFSDLTTWYFGSGS